MTQNKVNELQKRKDTKHEIQHIQTKRCLISRCSIVCLFFVLCMQPRPDCHNVICVCVFDYQLFFLSQQISFILHYRRHNCNIQILRTDKISTSFSKRNSFHNCFLVVFGYYTQAHSHTHRCTNMSFVDFHKIHLQSLFIFLLRHCGS